MRTDVVLRKAKFSFQNLIVDVCIILSAGVFSFMSSLGVFCGMAGQLSSGCGAYYHVLSVIMGLNGVLAGFAVMRILAGFFGWQLVSRKLDLVLLLLPPGMVFFLWAVLTWA